MKKELPIWAILVLGPFGGIAFFMLGILADDSKLRRSFLAVGGFLLLLAISSIATWGWGIYKRRIRFDALKKTPREINCQADATLREAAELLRGSKRDDA